MRLGLFLYRFVTWCAAPFAGIIFRRRALRGKENSRRINERLAKTLPSRPDGQLIWFHAASVGESLLLLELAKSIHAGGTHTNILFTCQTLTGADRINAYIEAEQSLADVWTLQQMAPVDTPLAARRFVQHWRPSLAIFAEGEIWPNLLLELKRRDIPAALINARMTEKSISGWRQWPRTAKAVFGRFTLLLASDKKTAIGLSDIRGHDVTCVGNLKSALPPPRVDKTELQTFRKQLAGRSVLLAASTHEGEEAIVLDAVIKLPARPFIIIAPRHPERGDAIESLLKCSSLTYARRSREEAISQGTDILLADTMGEMGLWFHLSDTVYLGGGHTPGVGGHNPLEPLRLSKPVMTGPSLFNFEDVVEPLIKNGALTIVNSVAEFTTAYPLAKPDSALVQQLEDNAYGPMQLTLAALKPLLVGIEGAQ